MANEIANGMAAADFGDQFMKLLMIQLKYQDPLDPVSDKDFLAQMSQFSSLAELTKLNTSFSQALKIQEVNEARELINQNITYRDPETGGTSSGVVSGVRIGQDSEIFMLVNGQEVPLSNLDGVYGP